MVFLTNISFPLAHIIINMSTMLEYFKGLLSMIVIYCVGKILQRSLGIHFKLWTRYSLPLEAQRLLEK